MGYSGGIEPNVTMDTENQSQPSSELPNEGGTRGANRIFEAIGLFFLEVIKIVILAAITILFVRHFLFKPFYVHGQSMESTFFQHEYLIIDELSYRFVDPKRGDIVVFESPTEPGEFYIKRVIGLPGERIKIEDNKVIIYNEAHPQGIVLDEPYLDADIETDGSRNVTIGENHYYVLGDNREASFDSRRFGQIEREAIVGRTWFRGYPLTRIGTFSAPDYNL